VTAQAAIRARGWVVLLVAQVVGIVILIGLPVGIGWVALYLILNTSAAAAVAFAVRLHRPVPRRPWLVLTAGLITYTIANVVFFPAMAGLTEPLPFPSFADALYFCAYGLIVSAGVLVAIARGAFRKLGDAVDAMIVAGAFGVVVFQTLMAPYLDPAEDMEPLGRAAAAAYPIIDIALVGIGAWIAFSGVARSVPLAFLAAYLVAQLTADGFYGLDLLAGTLDKVRLEFVLWPISLAALGAAALHPSMTLVTTQYLPAPGTDRRRIVLLGIAALTGPIATAIDAIEPDHDTFLLAIISAVIVTLVAVRVFMLTVDLDTHQRTIADRDALNSVLESVLQSSGAMTRSERITPGHRAAESDYEYMSEAGEKITGHPVEDFLSRRLNWEDLVHPDDLAAWRTRFGEWIEAAEVGGPAAPDTLIQRYRIVRRDGAIRWIRDSVSTSRDEQGTLTRVTGVVIDVTAEVEAEDRVAALNDELEARVSARTVELTEARSLLEQVLALVPGVVSSGRYDRSEVTYVSGFIETLLGYPPDEVPRTFEWWRELVHPDDRATVAAVVQAALASGAPVLFFETRFQRRDGTYVWAYTTQRITYAEDGAPESYVGLAIDINDRKAAEQALVALRAEADRANRAKSEFMSSMSHELRTPLNAILGFGQLLETSQLAGDDREGAREIVQAGRNLLAMIDDVLEFSRLDAGRVSLSIEPVEIGALVRETVDLARPQAEQHDVTIVDLVPADEEIVVLADRRRLGQVLLNLLSNGAKFNRPGGSITMTALISDGHARLVAADTGIGIEPDHLGRIFDPFEARAGQRTGPRSLGLGLALSSRLTKAMGGTLTATSEFGVGSTFTVELPLATEFPDAGAGSTRAIDRGPASDASFGHTILYIEDNLANLHLVERVISRHAGIRMLAAMQGRLGIDLAREHQPDLILLDLHLPDVDPDETLRELKADARTRDIPVIILSSEPSASEARRMIELGALDFIAKPFDIARLVTLVNGVLNAS